MINRSVKTKVIRNSDFEILLYVQNQTCSVLLSSIVNIDSKEFDQFSKISSSLPKNIIENSSKLHVKFQMYDSIIIYFGVK